MFLAEGRPSPESLIRSAYTSFCGTMMVWPPSVSWYFTPSVLSLSTMAEASLPARLLKSGV